MEGKRVTGEILFISSIVGIFLPECNKRNWAACVRSCGDYSVARLERVRDNPLASKCFTIRPIKNVL